MKKISKLLYALAIFPVLSLGFVASSDASSMARSGLTMYDGTKLVGVMVKARDGVELGRIDDLVVTSQGNVGFAIVDQVTPPDLEDPWSGHLVAVPFSALMISKGKSQGIQVVLNADKEKFYEAPEAPSSFFGSKAHVNLQTAASLDRYFGVQPYWTEKPEKADCHQ